MIQNRPYRLFAIVMAFVVLLSSTGFGLVEHSCMMRGKSVELAALKKTATGCKACKPATESKTRIASSLQFKKKACCEESHKYHNVKVVSSASFTIKLLKPAADPAAIPFQNFLFEGSNLPLIVSPLTTSFHSFSSLHYGRSMLSFVQTFLI
ncbi:HYC_CC_PP family protein [Salmonirosea aquatica]|uniref:Uncharacterized protein n=1 Tax=Salmonirosea aquatica TaxID=2654236 RepID=A0A7C9BHE0_9BACT|nr:hypothetical protein [Cytophagaceae bacterium SJW1-29]